MINHDTMQEYETDIDHFCSLYPELTREEVLDMLYEMDDME